MVGVAKPGCEHNTRLPEAVRGVLQLDKLPASQLHLGQGAGEGRGWANLDGLDLVSQSGLRLLGRVNVQAPGNGLE